jgi:hypothetical protein
VNLHHFYHIYVDGNWLEPVEEHITALQKFGLYEALTSFHIGFVGKRENQLAAHQYIQSRGIIYQIADEQESGWEQVTQIPMWEFAKKNEGLILYAHSKGSSNISDVNIRWRRSMIYWNVIAWKFAVEKLQDHEMYGCHWIQPLLQGMPEHRQGNWMFAGTFFWGRCERIAKLPRPALNHRHEAEGWVGYGYAEEPFWVYDPTPYFPNTGPFADAWIGIGAVEFREGKSYSPIKTVNEIPI